VRLLFTLLAVLLTGPAHASDWLSVQGLEPDDADAAKIRPFGFVQVSAEAIASRPVEGLTGDLAAYNGERAAFNHVVGTSTPARISLRRVRAGLRGDIPRTDGRVSTFVAVELGQNPLTTTAADGWRPRLMDASLTVRSPWGVHLRVGQFKLPLADETLEAFHLTTDLVRFSPVVGRLLMERDVVGGRINGFRDVGAQVFGSHVVRDTEISWAAMASNGTVELARSNPGLDVTGRVQVARLFDGPRRNPFRDEVAVFGFATTGLRHGPDGQDVRRTRAGGGAQLRREGVRLRSEVTWGEGMLTAGRAPPFDGGSLVVEPDGSAVGVTGLASVRLQGTWEVGLAGSHLDSMLGAGAKRRVFDDVTAFGQLHLSPKVWFDLNLAWRHARAPEGSENARRILETTGPYGAVMATVIL